MAISNKLIVLVTLAVLAMGDHHMVMAKPQHTSEEEKADPCEVIKESNTVFKYLRNNCLDREKTSLSCSFKCATFKMGFLNPEGRVDERYIRLAIEKYVGDALTPAITQAAVKCIEKHGGRYDVNDRSCKSFLPFNKCLLDAIDLAGC